MRGSVTALLALAGCSQVFGLDPPTRVPPDGPGSMVTGRYYGRHLHFDANLAPQEDEYIFETPNAEVVLADGTKPPITWLSNGEFTFANAGQRYAFRITYPGTTVEYQMSTSRLVLASFLTNHPDGDVAGPGTTVTYRINDASEPNSLTYVATLGQWMTKRRTTGSNTDFSIDWAQMNSLASPTLLDVARHDRISFAQFTPDILNFFRLTHFRIDALDMASGTNHTITGSSMPVQLDRCVRLDVPLSTTAARLRNAGYAPTDASVLVASYPTLTMGPMYAPLLALASPPLDGLAATLTYGDPYRGAPVLHVGVTQQRPIRIGTATPQAANIGTSYLVRAEPDCNTATIGEPDGGIPTNILFAGKPLSQDDDQQVTLDRSRPIELSWQVSAGTADLTITILFEVTTELTATKLVARAHFVTTTQSVQIDPALFSAGKTYVFTISAAKGWADAEKGDFSQASMPFTSSFTWPGTFVVN